MTITPEQLIGTWTLVSWTRIEGDVRSDRFGPGVKGLISYTADGFIFAQLEAADRKPFAGGDPFGGTPDECQAAMSTGLSYCGRWRLDGDTIVHSVALSTFPNWVGTELLRFARVEGDRVVLRTPPLPRKGVIGTAELVWRRANRHDP